MTRSELEQRARTMLSRDPFFTGADYDSSIQDGYDEVVAFSGCNIKSITIPFQQNLTYYNMLELIPDLIGIIGIYNNVVKRWMLPTGFLQLESETSIWEGMVGTPEYFCPISHRYVAIYKKPSVVSYGDMFVFYMAAAPTLVNSSDVFVIPDEHMDALENYVKTDLNEQAQDFKKALLYFQDYEAMLGKLVKWVKSDRNPNLTHGLKG